MLPHKLIDAEDPHCLYCLGQCSISGEGITPDLFVDEYTCQVCFEKFEILRHNDDEPHGFSFTCDNKVVGIYYPEQTARIIHIKDITTDYDVENPVIVPYFFPNFNNKKALNNKLKTYLTFA